MAEMTLEQVLTGLRAMKAHPNSLFAQWGDAIESAIAERERTMAEPGGWNLVPIEPTDAMVDAGRIVTNLPRGIGQVTNWASDRWKAMLAAAPKPTHNTPEVTL